MGNVTEIMYLSRKNFKATIKRISKDEFVIISTGEKKSFVHTENRSEGKNCLRRTLRRLRNLLNSNITDVTKCRWITLTYKENMTDTVRLYKDFDKFNKRMKYYFQKQNMSYEYIVAMEPQGRGAWHCHLVMIFNCKAPFIENSILADIWGHGYVTVKKLDDVDNVGAYLTAYLGDMELEEALKTKISLDEISCKEVEYKDVTGELKKKYYVKGARLNMYPPGFNLYRASRGIEKPLEYETDNKTATKKASVGALTFSRTTYLELDDGFNTIIDKRYYNKKRVQNQVFEQSHIEEQNNIPVKSTFIDEVNYAKGRLDSMSWLPWYDTDTGEIYNTPFDE